MEASDLTKIWVSQRFGGLLHTIPIDVIKYCSHGMWYICSISMMILFLTYLMVQSNFLLSWREETLVVNDSDVVCAVVAAVWCQSVSRSVLDICHKWPKLPQSACHIDTVINYTLLSSDLLSLEEPRNLTPWVICLQPSSRASSARKKWGS